MILFWLIGAALLFVAVMFVAVPLWRGRAVNNVVERNAANLQILRDQSAELDTDLKNDLLAPELYEQGKRELESRVLDEVAGSEQAATETAARPFRALAVGLSALLVMLSVGVYLAVGTPDAFSPANPHAGVSAMGGSVRTDTALAELEQKVKANPDDATSLLMLARSYMDAERYAESARGYAELVKRVPNEAWVWADYADAAAMAQGQTLRGKPTEFINQALALDPNNMKGLALAGSAAMERGDFAVAIQHWEKLRVQLPPDSEDARAIEGGLAEARQLLSHIKGGKAPMLEPIAPPAQTAAAGKERITGKVTLDPSLKGKFSPDDTVFVLARAAQGPKMPLAILRKQVRDLPITFELDDSMAMAPQMTLSAFDQVVVVARISKSGTAMPQAGDAEGLSQPLRPGSKNVNVKIGAIVQ
ncbi:c-type cytochrome biogenesis protein CcmI [Ferrigenium sp. UT5]|uniref:c-type cytochrome biogenesis protein CcmI n=1 Tax=Ferrigenium sp. UT5 TaxID=3242105 RepID=UPI00354C97B1